MLTLVMGTGYTGKRVLEQLPGALGLSRSFIESTRTTMCLDLDTASSLPVVLPDEYRVIYSIPPAGDDIDERLRHFLELLDPTPKRFVYISTTGVYGDCNGKRIDERQQPKPATSRARKRVTAEGQLTDWAVANDTDLTILRTPSIYGPGRLGEERIRNREPVLLESESIPGNRIHVDDLVRCCIAALNTPPGVYNVGDGDHRSASWFACEVAQQLNVPPPPQVSRETLAQHVSTLRLSFLSEPRQIDTQKMHEILGVVPTYSNPQEGIRASRANTA